VKRVALLAAFVTSTLASSAWADSASVERAMDDWFQGERNEGYVFMGLGAMSAGVGGYLLTRDDDFSRGAAYSALGLGVLELAFSTTYLLSLPGLHDELRDDLARDPVRFQRDESERMRGISRRFVWYRYAELGVLATGAGLATYGFARDERLWAGIGVSAGTHAVALLLLDLFAERRAHTYRDAVESFSPGVSAALVPRGRELRFELALARGSF